MRPRSFGMSDMRKNRTAEEFEAELEAKRRRPYHFWRHVADHSTTNVVQLDDGRRMYYSECGADREQIDKYHAEHSSGFWQYLGTGKIYSICGRLQGEFWSKP